MFKRIVILTLLLFSANIAIALDYSGDFSQRSVIMRSLNGETNVNQEQKALIQSKKLYPNTQCLIDEIKKGNYDNVELLLKAGVDSNRTYMSDYPIYVAARNNKTEIVKLLRQYGAKLDMGFFSELYEAVRNKNKELSQYLIDEGSRPNYQDSITGNTILYLSLKNNMHDISRQLILKGAKADRASVYYIKKHKLKNLIEGLD